MEFKYILKKIIKPSLYIRGMRLLVREGPSEVIYRMKCKLSGRDYVYEKWYLRNFPDKTKLKEEAQTTFSYEPLISIIVPTYNTPLAYLKQMIQSVLDQSYHKWELCIADASDEDSAAKEYLHKFCLRDQRIKIVFLEENLGIASNTNAALSLAKGDYVAFLDHDDIITPNALFEIVSSLQQSHYDMIYTDEDFVSEDLGKHFGPSFKPDWSPELLCSHNYITHFLVLKMSFLNKVGKFNSKYDGAQDYDLVLRCSEKTDSIFHIPKVLYNWRVCENSVASDSNNKLYAYEAGKNALIAHLKRTNIDGDVSMLTNPLGYYHVSYSTKNTPRVSIIIPNKDHVRDLKTCLDSLYNINNYNNIEIIIIENNSENQDTFKYYDYIQTKFKNIKIITYDGNFNYSKINNFGVEKASSDYILFLNNDTKMINPNSIKEMLGLCMKPEIGIVGAKLLYGDNTIQHAGVLIGYSGCAQHVFSGLSSNDYGYQLRAVINCNYSCVTAACMMIKRSIFNKVGGFSPEFAVAFNDVDLCLRVRELNKYVVYCPSSLWFHYESKTRGYEKGRDNRKRFSLEKQMLRNTWKKYFEGNDPYYNDNFLRYGMPYRLPIDDKEPKEVIYD